MRTRKLTIYAFAAIAALVTACSNEDSVSNDENPKGVVIRAAAGTPTGKPDTRLGYEDDTTAPGGSNKMKITWAENDAFTVYAGSSKVDYLIESGTEGSNSATFEGAWDNAPADGTMLYALYPKSTTSSSATNVNILLDKQKGTLNDLKDFNYMTASTTYAAGDLKFSFTHQVAIVKLVLTFPSGVTGDATNIGLRGTGIIQSQRLDMTDNTINSKVEGYVTTGTNSLPVTDSEVTAYLCVFPGDISDAKVTATIGNKLYEAPLAAKEVTAGDMYTVTISLTEVKINFSKDLAAQLTDAGTKPMLLGSGSNSITNPYLITNGEELQWVRMNCASPNHYRLMADITVSGSGSNWMAMSRDDYFKGYFDGNNHLLSGINMEISDNDIAFANCAAGIFGTVSGGNVRNVKAEASVKSLSNTVTIGRSCGGIASSLRGGGSIVNCSFEGSVTWQGVTSSGTVGGIVGDCDNGFIAACYNKATVSGVENVHTGGVVGQIANIKTKVYGCYNSGSVSGNSSSKGGFAGDLYNTPKLEGCFFSTGFDNSFGSYSSNWSSNITEMNKALSNWNRLVASGSRDVKSCDYHFESSSPTPITVAGAPQ